MSWFCSKLTFSLKEILDYFQQNKFHSRTWLRGTKRRNWLHPALQLQNKVCWQPQVSYLLMVKGCRACCCLGMPMMLGDDLLGLPMLPLLPPPPPPLSPPIPAVCAVGPPTCWLWFRTLRLLMGRMPLQRRGNWNWGGEIAAVLIYELERKWNLILNTSCFENYETKVHDWFTGLKKNKKKQEDSVLLEVTKN